MPIPAFACSLVWRPGKGLFVTHQISRNETGSAETLNAIALRLIEADRDRSVCGVLLF